MDVEQAFLAVLVALALVFSALVVKPFFTYVALAVLLAYTLYPVQRRLAPRFGPRVSAALVMVAALVLFVLPLLVLLQVVLEQAVMVVELIQEFDVETVQEYVDVEVVEEFLATELGQRLVAAVSASVGSLAQNLVDVVRTGLGSVAQGAAGFITGVSKLFLGLTIFAFLLYYLLVGGESVVDWLRGVTPLPRDVQAELLAELDRLTYAILVTTLAVAVVQAVLTGIALAVLGFSNVVFWTVVAVILGVLPFVGSMFIWIPAALLLIARGDVVPGVGLLVYGFGLVNLSDNYLRPVIGGRSANMNPGLLVLGIFGGIAVFGITGLFLGPIVLGFTRTVLRIASREY